MHFDVPNSKMQEFSLTETICWRIGQLKVRFSKNDPVPFGVLKRDSCVRFEPILTHF